MNDLSSVFIHLPPGSARTPLCKMRSSLCALVFRCCYDDQIGHRDDAADTLRITSLEFFFVYSKTTSEPGPSDFINRLVLLTESITRFVYSIEINPGRPAMLL